MNKHAFCIIAHKDVEQINILLHILDNLKVDIYLHIDLKSSIVPSDIKTPKYSKLFFVTQHDVRWGDISQVHTELELFRSVIYSSISYERIHLISAQDMPMKSISYILDFFERNDNKQFEFINFSENPKAIRRLQYYWFCTKHMRQGFLFKLIRHSLLLVQKIMHVNRLNKVALAYKYGANWASLTLPAVRYLVSEYPKYQGIFKHSVCADELYKQMLLWRGKFHFSEKGNLRYAKFNGGASPELVSKEKLNELYSNPDVLFARKFDMCESDVIDLVRYHLQRRSENDAL